MTREVRDAPQFYLTAPSPCPYLPGQQERKIFTHLVGKRAASLNDLLTQTGFRRSQTIAYRPACESCRACVSVRVLVDDFRPNDSQRRAMRANVDVVGTFVPPKPTNEHFSLFRAYLDARHPEGGMADMSSLDFAMMVEDTHIDTHLAEYRAAPRARRGGAGPLYAVCLTDRLADGLSLVYSFYAPAPCAPLARRLRDPRPHRQGPRARPAARLSRLLGRGVEEDGLQGGLPAAGAPRPARLDAGGAIRSPGSLIQIKPPAAAPSIVTSVDRLTYPPRPKGQELRNR